jgi:hypothetical protein
MSRGIGLAIPLALQRGHVMVFIAWLMNLAEFMITGNGLFVLVRVRLARNLYATLAEIEEEFSNAITGLRLVPRTCPVSCELWLYSRYGTLRHFRVGNAGLVEINCYGTPLDQVKPDMEPAFTPGKTGTLPGPASAGTVPGPGVSGIDPKSPIYRWLVKCNAARRGDEAAGSAGSCGLKKILDYAKPGGTSQRNAGKKPVRKKVKATSPEDPEEIRNREKLAAGADQTAGENPASRSTVVAVPGETQCLEKPVMEQTPVPQSGVPANGESPSEGIPGSLGYTGKDMDPPVPGEKREVI